MRTIRAIVRNGDLKPIDPINLPENTAVTVALLDDDLPADAITELAQNNPAFSFLDDPREQLYSKSDGEAI